MLTPRGGGGGRGKGRGGLACEKDEYAFQTI